MGDGAKAAKRSSDESDGFVRVGPMTAEEGACVNDKSTRAEVLWCAVLALGTDGEGSDGPETGSKKSKIAGALLDGAREGG